MKEMPKWQVPVTIVCLLTGMFAVSAFRTNSAYQTSRQDGSKNKNLVGIIHYLENETQTMETNVKNIRKDIDDIQKDQVSKLKNSIDLQNKLKNLKSSVGLTDSVAPGIVITLDDNKQGAESARTANPEQYDPKDYIVHDKNILYLVTALRNAGAKEISVNNQRVIATSSIRCAGPIIIVNSTRLAPPYVIKAHGAPALLQQAVEKSDEYVYIQSNNLPISIVQQQDISIPAYNGPVKFTFAQIKKEGAQ